MPASKPSGDIPVQADTRFLDCLRDVAFLPLPQAKHLASLRRRIENCAVKDGKGCLTHQGGREHLLLLF